MIHTVKGFSIVVEGKVNDYLIFLVYFSLLFQLTFLIGICYVVGTILNTTDTKLVILVNKAQMCCPHGAHLEGDK